MSTSDFAKYTVVTPTYQDVAAQYDQFAKISRFRLIR
jgi:hypothetical protein